jgi:zinc protease
MSWTEGVQRLVLPNGLTVLVQRHATAPVVAVVTHVRAGYFDEPDEWVGIAHVLEHMFFKGTARRGPGDLARETQLVGGYVNAGTIYDQTVYYTVLPSAVQGLERALDVQADALMHAALAPRQLRRELDVIIQEAKRKLDSPPAVAAESLYELLFRVHRMRRWRIGTEAGLRRLTPADVRAYYTTRYTPDRVIVAIVGDVDEGRALRLAEATYGAWSRAPARVAASPPERRGAMAASRVVRGDVERPLARIGWRTVGTLHEDTPALDVAATLLGVGRGSSLYRAVRLPGLARRVSASHYTPTEVGVFVMEIDGESGSLDDAVIRTIRVVDALGADGPTPDELLRARAMLSAQWARRFESMDGRASALCEAEALGDYRLVDELYRHTVEVDSAGVQRVVRRYLDLHQACAVLYLADGMDTALTGGKWPPPPHDAVSAGSPAPMTVEAWRTMPARKAVGNVEQHAGAIGRWSVAGADLLVKSKRGSGLVTVGLHFMGLPAAETRGNAGISCLFARSALRGAGGRDGEELAQLTESMGGVLAAGVSADTLGWWVTVRNDALPQAVQVLDLVAREPDLSGGDLATEREKQIGDARSARDDMFRHPIQRVLAEAFRDDAYGLPALGEPETVAGLDDHLVRAWGQRAARRRALAVAVGDLDVTALLEGLAPLAGWSGRECEPEARGRPQWRTGRSGERRGKAQSALAMAFPAVAANAPERYAVIVLASLLSGLAGRLFESIREKRSLAYTVTAAPWMAARAGAIVAYIATSPGREEEARAAMLDELARVSTHPPGEDELARARNYAAGTAEIRKQHARSIADQMLDAWVCGTIDELEEAPSRLRAVTCDQLVEAAERSLNPEMRAEYVVRGTGRSR